MPAEKCYTGHMHRLLLLLAAYSFCFAEETTDVSALLPDASTGLTLDEDAFESIRADMKAGRPTGEANVDTALWQRAMKSVSTEARDALLMCLLLRLNPELEPEKALPELIALLQLHTRAASGDPAAAAELAQALRSGSWHALRFPQDAEAAAQPARPRLPLFGK